MSTATLALSSLQQRVSDAEWQARTRLAQAYVLAAKLRWTDHIYTHFSLRVPGEQPHILINAYGQTFDEIRPETLVKIDIDGNIIDDPTGLGVNPAGFVIHSAIHRARPDAHAVMHTHTAAGIGVSAQKQGLLMISQHSTRFYQRVGYHDYEGIALDLDEQQRIVADLGARNALILRNHGLLTSGGSIEEAFYNLYYLERACQAQLAAQSGGAELFILPDAVAEKAALAFEQAINNKKYLLHWDAYIRQLNRNAL